MNLKKSASKKVSPDSKVHPEDWPRYKPATEADAYMLQQFVTREVNSHLQTYPLSRNGVHFWRAWLALRKTGQPVPERMLRYVDEMAERLCRAHGQVKIANAVEMTNDKGGGPKGANLANGEFNKRSLMLEVLAEFTRVGGVVPSDGTRPQRVSNSVMKAVADRHNLTMGDVKSRWSAYWKDAGNHQNQNAADELIRAWNPTKLDR